MKENPQLVNSAAIASTSDGVPRSNAMTALQWLERVLLSGQLTRVAQHLALAIFNLAQLQEKNGVSASMRDLERITGWGRSTLRDHLAELDHFIHVELAKGRGKTLFELQGMIEDAIGAALASAIDIRQPDTSGFVASIADAIVAGEADANFVASQPDEIVSEPLAITACGQPAGHKPETVVASPPDNTPLVASQPDTIVASQPDTNRAKKERSPHTPLKEKNPIPLEEGEGEISDNSQASPLEAFNLYNDTALRVGIQQARTLTPQRRKSIAARMREHGGLEAWKTALANIERSAFLQGSNDRGWRADLDFLLQAKSFTKVVEGSYGNGAHGSAPGPQKPKVTDRDRIAQIAREIDEKERQKAPSWRVSHEH